MKADNATLVRLKLDGSPGIPPAVKTFKSLAPEVVFTMCCQYIVDNADTAMVSVAKGG